MEGGRYEDVVSDSDEGNTVEVVTRDLKWRVSTRKGFMG